MKTEHTLKGEAAGLEDGGGDGTGLGEDALTGVEGEEEEANKPPNDLPLDEEAGATAVLTTLVGTGAGAGAGQGNR